MFSLRKFEFEYPSYRKYSVGLNAADPNDRTSFKVPVLEEGPLEAALYWRKQFLEMAEIKALDAAAKFQNALLTTTGEAKEKWRDARDAVLQPGGAAAPLNPTDVRFAATMLGFMRLMGATDETAENLTEFLQNARKPQSMSVQDFKTRLTELDRYLPALPGPQNQRLGEAALFAIIKKSVLPGVNNLSRQTSGHKFRQYPS